MIGDLVFGPGFGVYLGILVIGMLVALEVLALRDRTPPAWLRQAMFSALVVLLFVIVGRFIRFV